MFLIPVGSSNDLYEVLLMKYKKILTAVSILMGVSSCGGGGGGGSSNPTPSGGTTSSVIGCSQHTDFFEQLSGDRVGTISTFSIPGMPNCEFDVLMTINNDPMANTCQMTADLSYTAQIVDAGSTRVCDVSEGRRFNVLFGEAISLQDQVNLPLRLIFQPVGSQPLQDANGFLIEYPVSGGSDIEIDENFNINVEGQFLTRP